MSLSKMVYGYAFGLRKRFFTAEVWQGFRISGKSELVIRLKKADRVVYLVRFVFCFLPSDSAARKEMISSVSIDSISLLLFELPNLASKEV